MRTHILILLTIGCGLLYSTSVQSQDLKLDSVYLDFGLQQSTEFENFRKAIYEAYDADGKPTQILVLRKLDTGEWQNFRRRHLTYEDGYLVNLLIEQWNPANETWNDRVERSYTYQNDEVVNKLVRKPSTLGMPLENYEQWNYYPNAFGDLQGVIYQTWQNGAWENVSQQTWSYNANMQMTEQLLEVWDGNDWVNFRRRYYVYDFDTGVIDQSTEYKWSVANQEWDYKFWIFYLTDGGYVPIGTRTLVWNDVDEVWENQIREEFDFDPGYQLNHRVLQSWDGNVWVNQYRVGYEYDGETLSSISDKWDNNDQSWDLHARFQMSFGSDQQLVEEKGWQFWSQNQQEWLNDTSTYRRSYYWSEEGVATEEIQLDIECLVPNPYSPGMEISCTSKTLSGKVQVVLLNSMGQQVYRSEEYLNSSFSLQSNSLNTGMYILHLQKEDQLLLSKKIVIAQ
ncbi:MAG: T9SS type A sorting domain-containing protein [Bacteroidetes bacterium]|nr:T9SS type A sorting domain-containing protein [Bacteroidota bacterium]